MNACNYNEIGFMAVIRELERREKCPFIDELIEAKRQEDAAIKAKRERLFPYACEIVKPHKNCTADELYDQIIGTVDSLLALPVIPPQVEDWLQKYHARQAFENEVFREVYSRRFPRHSTRAKQVAFIDKAHKEFNERVKPCDLYRYFDGNGKLLYVGISHQSLLRAYQHTKSAVWFRQFSYMEREECLSRAHAIDAEKVAIRVEQPLFNIVHSLTGGTP